MIGLPVVITTPIAHMDVIIHLGIGLGCSAREVSAEARPYPVPQTSLDISSHSDPRLSGGYC